MINQEIDRIIRHQSISRRLWLRDAVDATDSDSDLIVNNYLDPELHVINGRPWNVVPALAEKLGAGLIVMGTAARTGLSRLFRGNMSEKVLFRSNSSFMIINERVRSSTPILPVRKRGQHDRVPIDREWMLARDRAAIGNESHGEAH